MLLPENWDKMSKEDRRSYLNTDMGGEPEGVKQREKVCIAEIWCELFNGSPKDLSSGNKDSREINAFLNSIKGWQKSKSPVKCGPYSSQRCFYKVL